MLKELSNETGFSTLRLLNDYFWSVIRHGTLIRQYTIGEFWRKSNMERSKCLTYPRMVRYMNKYNNRNFIHYLNEKHHFNRYFHEFVKRDWLYVRDVDESSFSQFLDRHECISTTTEKSDGIRPLMKRKTINTIRTMTILDRNGKGHVVKAMLRAGVGDTVVDNYAQGGSIYEVDVNSGVVNSYGKSKAGNLHLLHPGTDIVMLGYKIPKWEQVVELSEKAAEHLPQVRIIGWDVAITQNGVQMIEGNHNPDYELYEYIGSTGYNEIFKSLL